MTAVTGVVLFRSESKDSGFHASERPGEFLVLKKIDKDKKDRYRQLRIDKD